MDLISMRSKHFCASSARKLGRQQKKRSTRSRKRWYFSTSCSGTSKNLELKGKFLEYLHQLSRREGVFNKTSGSLTTCQSKYHLEVFADEELLLLLVSRHQVEYPGCNSIWSYLGGDCQQYIREFCADATGISFGHMDLIVTTSTLVLPSRLPAPGPIPSRAGKRVNRELRKPSFH